MSAKKISVKSKRNKSFYSFLRKENIEKKLRNRKTSTEK